jgi:hypothetical protein
VFRKYLGYLRQSPNHYLSCPDQQNASPNVDRKTLVYQLGERGLNELIRRGLVPKRYSPNVEQRPLAATRNFAFALHRSNSYYHEIIVDLGYFAPLHQFVRSDPNLRLLDFARLTFHAATIVVLVAFEVLAGCCCGTVAKRRPIFQPGKRGSDLLWRLGGMERRYESARGCRESSSLYPLIVARREF